MMRRQEEMRMGRDRESSVGSADWIEMAKEAIAVLRKITQPPLMYGTLTGLDSGETVDISTTTGQSYVVHFDPRLKDKLKVGQTVRINPETMAVVDIRGDIKSRNSSSVKDVLKDGRVKIDAKGIERVLQTSVQGLKVGDQILVDESYSVVVENLGNNTQAFKIDRVPEVPWSKIGGLEQTIDEIKTVVEQPLLHREIYAKFPGRQAPRGVLLYGPPGCGKTLIGKAVAYNLALRTKELSGGELNGYFLYASGPEFLQKWVGTGEEKVREIFANARDTVARTGGHVTIFVDEPEAVLKQRGTGVSSDASDSIVNQFLTEMDGLKSSENILVLLATNRQEMLDSAIVRPGRVDRKIYVPRPNKEGAEQIFNIYLQGMPFASQGLRGFVGNTGSPKDFARYVASEIFDKSLPMLRISYRDGSESTLDYKHIFSGAGAVSIVGRATDYAIKRAIEGDKPGLTREDLSAAVQKEYEENRVLSNLATPDDVRIASNGRVDQILNITPCYIHSEQRQVQGVGR